MASEHVSAVMKLFRRAGDYTYYDVAYVRGRKHDMYDITVVRYVVCKSIRGI